MVKHEVNAKDHERTHADRLFELAHERWRQGRLKSAFRLFLAGAKTGDVGCQLNLGNFYSDGIGLRPNPAAALEWYTRAYRQKYGPAASNIGVLFRNEGKLREALSWFERAAKLGDGDANLEIAKIYLGRNERSRAAYYLKRTLGARTGDTTEASREEASFLLRELGKRKPEASPHRRLPGTSLKVSDPRLS